MSTRSSRPDPQASTPDASQAFASMSAAGMDMFQEWLKAASSAIPGTPSASSSAGPLGSMGSMGSWGLPTLDPQELDKRIQDLRTVQFWLEQNARMIAMTIQGLEVQRMTLNTLQGMNVSMEAVRDALKARHAPQAAAPADPGPETPERATATGPSPTEEAPEPASGESSTQADLINPMRWWDTLTQQFAHLATQATQPVATDLTRPGSPSKSRQPAAKTSGRSKAPAKKSVKSRAAAPGTTKGSKAAGRGGD